MVCRAGENACSRQTRPSLAMTESEDDKTHFSGPPRRWGGPEWRVVTSVSRECKKRVSPADPAVPRPDRGRGRPDSLHGTA